MYQPRLSHTERFLRTLAPWILAAILALVTAGVLLQPHAAGAEDTGLPAVPGVYLRLADGGYASLSRTSAVELSRWPAGALRSTEDPLPAIVALWPDRLQNPQLVELQAGLGMEFGEDGCPYVGSVSEGSAAAGAGLQAGDEILAIGTEIFDCERQFGDLMVGDKVDLFVRRSGSNKKLPVVMTPSTTAAMPDARIDSQFVPDLGEGLFLYEVSPSSMLERGGVYCLFSEDFVDPDESAEPQDAYFCVILSRAPAGNLVLGEPASAVSTSTLGDRWLLDVPAGAMIALELQSEAFTPYLALRNADGDSVGYDSGAGAGESAVLGPFIFRDAGEYVVVVGDDEDANVGAYQLMVREFDPEPIAYGEQASVKFDKQAVVLLAFEGAANDLVSLQTDSSSSLSVSLLDANGELLASDTDGGLDFVSLPAGGAYYIGLVDRTGSPAPVQVSLANTEDIDKLASGRLPYDKVTVIETDTPAGVWMRLDNPEYRFVSFDMLGSDRNFALALYDAASRQQVKSNPDLNYWGASLEMFPVTPDRDYVVRIWQDGEQRTARVKPVGLKSPSDGAAGELEQNRSVAGVQMSDMLSRWTVDAPQGTRVSILSEDSRILGVYSESGEILELQSGAANDWSGGIASFDATEDGPFTVFGDGNRQYRLTLVDPMAEEETTLGVMGLNQVRQQEDIALDQKQGVDWLLFGEEKQHVTIALTSDQFSPRLELLAPDGTSLGTNGGSNPAQIEAIELPATGLYRIRVNSLSGEETGSYSLSVRDAGYRADYQGVLQLGKAVAADIALPVGHIWEFEGEAGDEISLEMTADNFDPILFLYGPDGELVARNNDGGAGRNARLPVTLPAAGRYEVAARGYMGQVGAYTLRLQEGLLETVQEEDDSPLARLAQAVGLELVEVPAGPVLMGSSDAQLEELVRRCETAGTTFPQGMGCSGAVASLAAFEKPQNSVDLRSFWIGKTELTAGQFRPFIETGGYYDSRWWTPSGWRATNEAGGPFAGGNAWLLGDNDPVFGVTSLEAMAYAKWLSAETGLLLRLPTEAEWEKAAHGESGTLYPWGNEYPNSKQGNFCDVNCPFAEVSPDFGIDDGYSLMAPVGSFPTGASPYGALDMAGNVPELTSTLWGGCSSNSEFIYPYEGGDGRENVDETSCRVLRDGLGFSAYPSLTHSALRILEGSANPAGFRVVWAPDTQGDATGSNGTGNDTASDAAPAESATAGANGSAGSSAGVDEILIPAGEFLMGCSPNDTDCDDDERPAHTVYLDTYYIDKYEVTNARYQKCVEAGACEPPHEESSYTRDSYYGSAEYAEYPVIKVDWYKADAFCKWTGGRLPTEAEWEKAARGTDGRIYPWGDSAPDETLLNFNGNDTTAVGSYPTGASPYGAMDMAGNVWEWVSDRYQEDYYDESPAQNPTGPESGEYRVLRGGSWGGNYLSVRAAGRDYFYPDNWYVSIGFRCVRSQ